MAVPVPRQTVKMVAYDTAATTHPITTDSPITSQGGTTCPSSISLAIVYNNGTGGIGTSITSAIGATYVRKLNLPNAANGFTLEIWEAIDVPGGAVETATWNGSASVSAVIGICELDQVAPVKYTDGISSPFDQLSSRVDVTSSTARTSATTVTTRNLGILDVFVGWMGWNDTRTCSAAGNTWTGLVTQKGSSTNLGLAFERKGAEFRAASGSSTIARFTMNSSGTQPAAVCGMAYLRDTILTGSNPDGEHEDGYHDNIEGVETVYKDATENLTYRSSASAPGGGTGGSQYSQAFGFFPRFYAKTGVTIGEDIEWNWNLTFGFDDGLGYFGFYYHTFNNEQLGTTLDTGDDETASSSGSQLLAIDANVTGWKTVTLSKTDDLNEDGVTATKIVSEGDGLGAGTNNHLYVGDYFGNLPQYFVLQLTYPSLAVRKSRFQRLTGAPRLVVQRVRR